MRFLLPILGLAIIVLGTTASAREFDSPMQRFIALQLRIAHGAAITCGFVLDSDRFKKRLVEDDISYDDLFSRNYTQAEQKEIADDANAARDAKPEGRYCEEAWKENGPDATLQDNVFFKCRKTAGCCR